MLGLFCLYTGSLLTRVRLCFHCDDQGSGARVVVRSTFLKLNLSRKWKGELENMQSERYFQSETEGIHTHTHTHTHIHTYTHTHIYTHTYTRTQTHTPTSCILPRHIRAICPPGPTQTHTSHPFLSHAHSPPPTSRFTHTLHSAALIASIGMYLLEIVSAFELPSLAKSFETRVDWHQVRVHVHVHVYVHVCVQSVCMSFETRVDWHQVRVHVRVHVCVHVCVCVCLRART